MRTPLMKMRARNLFLLAAIGGQKVPTNPIATPHMLFRPNK